MESLMRDLRSSGGEPRGGGGGAEFTDEQLMAMLQMMEQNPESAPPELSELMKTIREQSGQATAADKLAQGQDIVPEPGFVIKTTDDSGRKVFINICGSGKVAPPGAKWENGKVPDEVQKALDQGDNVDAAGQQALRCPISLGEPKIDMDRKGDACVVYDCVFNDEVCMTASKGHRQLKTFIIELAMGWIQHKHKLVLDPRYKLPRMKYKGEQVSSMRIRIDKKALVEEVPDDTIDEPQFPLVTKPIPVREPRPQPRNEPSASNKSVSSNGSSNNPATSNGGQQPKSTDSSRGKDSTLEYDVSFQGKPADAVEISVRVPEGGPHIEPEHLSVEVLAETVFIQSQGYQDVRVKLPFAVSATGAVATLSSDRQALQLVLPYRPFKDVLSEMKQEAPHQFGEIGLSNASILELEP